MSLRYIVTKNEYINGDSSRVGFGIAAVEEEDGITIVLRSIPDLSPSRVDVESLVDLFNENELDIIHLNDVIDDFI